MWVCPRDARTFFSRNNSRSEMANCVEPQSKQTARFGNKKKPGSPRLIRPGKWMLTSAPKFIWLADPHDPQGMPRLTKSVQNISQHSVSSSPSCVLSGFCNEDLMPEEHDAGERTQSGRLLLALVRLPAATRHTPSKMALSTL